MILGHSLALEVLADHHTYSNRVSRHLSIPNGFDPPAHTFYRRLIEPFFDGDSMAGFQPHCRAIAADLVGSLPRDTDIEAVSEIGEQLAVRVQTAFMGWPAHFQGRLATWARSNHEATRSRDRDAAARVAVDFADQVGEVLRQRRGLGDGAPDDPTSALMASRIDGRLLEDEEIVSIVRNWTMGEVGTIRASVGIVAHYLATHPDVQDELRARGDRISSAVDEMLRMNGPLVSNRRVATKDTRLGGCEIAEGDRLTVFWPAVNRDESVFGDPDSFRPEDNAPDNLLYGSGIHVCPGAPLARIQLDIVTSQLLEDDARIELSTKTPEYASHPAGGFSAVWIRLR